MTNTPRQQYGLGSFVKKIGKGLKKVAKSPIGKAALLGGGLWGLGKMGGIGSSGIGKNWWSKGIGLAKRGLMGTPFQSGPQSGTKGGLWNWIKGNKGQAALLGLGAAGMAAPFFAKDDEEEDEIQDWTIPSAAIGGLWDRTKDYYKTGRTGSNLAFMPSKDFVNPNFYAAQGGIARLANGGNPAEAQAEQMLKMEYQKYRNQGGTMSYQQFKMAVLQQAQSQGPMAQGQPQRGGYQGGELVEDASMMAATPAGMMEENVEEVTGEPTREQLEVLAMEIFQLRLEELDEEQLMVVYQAAMEQQPREEEMQEEIAFNPQMAAPQMAANGGRIGLANGGVLNSHVPGYTTPPGYNRFDYPSGGVRVRRAEGGLMDLGGMEKDYRQEGGFVPLGGEERADDVPARLSKNEFVFTADAVRAAGGGDIDKGAEVMENVMNNLEAGGEISEESQGGGGEEMISEEEIIEAPNGAQEMYDQQAMLQSRIA